MLMENNRIDITEEAISIFGDIVEYAYVLKPEWSSNFSLKMADVKYGSIEPVDGYPIFIKFINGKTFKMWSTESGGVKSVSEKEYVEDSKL